MVKQLVAREYCDETITLKQTLESGFIVLGERLARIKREQLWETQWNNFGEFCREMDFNEATASRLITVYETYIERYQLKQEDLSGKSWYNLYELRKVIPPKANTKSVRELVKSTETLNRQEIKNLIRHQEHGECKHEWEELHLRFCKCCGVKEKIFAE